MEIPIAQARAATTEPNTVNSLIPVHLRSGAQNFVDLLEDYYEYLNTDGLPSQEINNILVEQDIDRTSLQYLDSIQKEVAMNVPGAVAFDRVSLYKKIVNYYLTKGSRDSILTFFKIFYDEEVVVSYPRELLFAPSMGNWDPELSSESSEEAGAYRDDKSFPSGRDKIQDSYFWQNFSYVIESSLPIDNWKSNFLNLVHPAGFKFFGIIAILLVRSNKWIGRHVRFDEDSRKYVLDDSYSQKDYHYPYQTKFQENLDWMIGLIPPALLTKVNRYSFNEGYHTPTFQFGTVPYQSLLNILIIKYMDDDRFNLFVELILNYVITEDGNHFLRGRDTYLQDIKFLDRDGFSEFKNTLIGESLDNNNLLSQRIFHNVSSYVKSEITVVEETGRSIRKRIRGIVPSDTTKSIYTQESYNSDLKFARNEECWAKDIKGMTAISPWNSVAENLRSGVAISPRHVLYTEHAPLRKGYTIYFVTRNNITISRNIIQHKDISQAGRLTYGDFGVALLDLPLPDDIEIMKVLPTDSYNYFQITDHVSSPEDMIFNYHQTGMSGKDRPLVFNTDIEEKANIRFIESLKWGDASKNGIKGGRASTAGAPDGPASESQWFEANSGDSGNPIMMLLKGEAVLLAISLYKGSPFFGQYRNNNEVNLLIEDVDALESIDNSLEVTSFLYGRNRYTKQDNLVNGRPVYSGSEPANDSLSFSISWNETAWVRKIQNAFGGVPPTPIHNFDGDFPWQTPEGKEAQTGFTQFQPNVFFGTGHKLTTFDFKSDNRVEVFTPLKIAEGVDTSFSVAEGYSTSPDNLTSSHPDWEGREINFDAGDDSGPQWTNDPANGKIFCTGLFKNIRTAKPINARVGDIIKASVDFDFGTTPNQADDERTFMLSLSDIGSYPKDNEEVLSYNDLSFFIRFTENNNGFSQAKLMQRIEGAADIFVGALGLNAIQGDLLRLELEIDVKSSAATSTVTVSYQNVTDSTLMNNNPKVITGIDSGFYDSLLNRDPSISMTIQAGELTDTLIGTINVYNASFKNLVSFNTEQLATITPTSKTFTSNENILSFVYDSITYTKRSSLINGKPSYNNTSGGVISSQGSTWALLTFAGFGGLSQTVINNNDTPFPWLELDGTTSSDFSNLIGTTIIGDVVEISKKSFEADLPKTLLTLGTGSGNYIVGEEITQTNADTGVTVTSEILAINQGNIEILNQTASDGSDTLFSDTENPAPDYLYTAKQIDAVDESHYDVIVTDDRNFQIISDLANDGLPNGKVVLLKQLSAATDPLRLGNHRVTFNCTLNSGNITNNHLRLRYRDVSSSTSGATGNFNVVEGANSFTFEVFDDAASPHPQILFLSAAASAFDVSITNLKIEQIEGGTPVSPGNIVGTDSNASYIMTGSSELVEQKRDSFDASATHIQIEAINDINNYLNGKYKLISETSDKVTIKRPDSVTIPDSFTARIQLSKLDTYIAPSKYKKYTENIQQVKDKFS